MILIQMPYNLRFTDPTVEYFHLNLQYKNHILRDRD